MWLGHINNENGLEQTLKDHCLNVAKLSSDFLRNLKLCSFGYVEGIEHDMGKACNAFLHHMQENNSEHIDHSTVGAKYLQRFCSDTKNQNIIAPIELISMAIMSHHSGLENYLDHKGDSKYLKRLYKQLDTYEEAVTNYTKEIMNEDEILSLLEKCSEEFSQFMQNLLPRYDHNENGRKMQMFECSLLGRLLFSALIDADRKDAYDFEHQNEADLEIRKSERKPWNKYYETVEKYISKFDQNAGINALRTEISDACANAGKRVQGIYELSVPTGGGKTIASLRFALQHAMEHESIEHIIYVVPYNTILNQNADSVKTILFGDDEVSENEFLLHNSTVIASDEDRYRNYSERWNSNIIMTSTVQFLNALFSGKNQDARRMHQLSNAVIIIDEVQCLPVKVLNMFNTAMNFLSSICHSTILLCTATQPRLHEIAKPIQLAKDAALIHGYDAYYEKLKRVDIHSLYKEGGYTLDEFVDGCVSLLKESSSALIVMNTKAQACEVYQQLKQYISDDTTIIHLSTSMCHAHRQFCLTSIIKLLKQQKPVVLVSTNLIEAGVDISFPMAIRAMAGMDNLIQLAGRCNRNGELKGRKGNVYFMNLCDHDDPLTYLKEVRLKKQSTELFLYEFSKNPAQYGNDLSSISAMKTYYGIYNQMLQENNEKLIDYYVEDIQQTLYDLLSVNDSGRMAYYETHKKCAPLLFPFAYKEAGERFHVIDKDTYSVIVPYSENDDGRGGKEIIAKLMGKSLSSDEVRECLREAQNYTVELYEWQIDQLAEHVVLIEDYGVRVLAESNYSDELGVVLEDECLGIMI